MPNWNAVLQEIGKTPSSTTESAIDKVRRKYLAELNKHTNRNVIAYYSGFLSKPKVEGSDINDEDKNGFMLAIHKMDRRNGLDLILHTPGGEIAATESLIDYLREMFGTDIRAIVPQIAMSAGTMIACSCKEIVMGKHSNIGPVDPQFNGIPAIGVLKELELAFSDIQKDQRYALIWQPIIGRLNPSFVQLCHWAQERAQNLVIDALSRNMFSDIPTESQTEVVAKVVKTLSDLTSNKSHDRHFGYKECIDMGLKIKMLEEKGEGTLQDLVLTVHHCYMHTLSNTTAFKVIENHMGRAFVKQEIAQTQFSFMPPPLLDTGRPSN